MSSIFYLVKTFIDENSVECINDPDAQKLIRVNEEYVPHESETCKIIVVCANNNVKFSAEYSGQFGYLPIE